MGYHSPGVVSQAFALRVSERETFFHHEVLRHGEVWGFVDADGRWSRFQRPGSDAWIVPVWPGRAFAEACREATWAVGVPRRAWLEEYLYELLPAWDDEGLRIGQMVDSVGVGTPHLAGVHRCHLLHRMAAWERYGVPPEALWFDATEGASARLIRPFPPVPVRDSDDPLERFLLHRLLDGAMGGLFLSPYGPAPTTAEDWRFVISHQLVHRFLTAFGPLMVPELALAAIESFGTPLWQRIWSRIAGRIGAPDTSAPADLAFLGMETLGGHPTAVLQLPAGRRSAPFVALSHQKPDHLTILPFLGVEGGARLLEGADEGPLLPRTLHAFKKAVARYLRG